MTQDEDDRPGQSESTGSRRSPDHVVIPSAAVDAPDGPGQAEREFLRAREAWSPTLRTRAG